MSEPTCEASEDPTAAALAQVLAFRAAHPAATFADLESVVEQQLDQLRSQFLEQAVATPPECAAPAPCPTCGGHLQARGERERRLVTAGNGQVRLRRTYQWCSTCAVGFFPPGYHA